MPDAQPKPSAVEVLRGHRDSRWIDAVNTAGGGGYYCRCGSRFFGSIWQHQADMLAAAGLLVTPEHDAKVLRDAAARLLADLDENPLLRGLVGINGGAQAMRDYAVESLNEDADRIAAGGES